MIRAADQKNIGSEGRDDRPISRQRIRVPAGEAIAIVTFEGREGAESATIAVQVPGPAAGQVLVE
jgi:hypothetical protein